MAQARARLDAADWVDGKVTAGYQAQGVKENLQLPEGHPVAVQAGRDGAGGAGAVASVHVGSVAAEGFSADVQPLYGWRAFWHACGYGNSRNGFNRAADSHRCFGDAVSSLRLTNTTAAS